MVSPVHDRLSVLLPLLRTPEPPTLDQGPRAGTLGSPAVHDAVGRVCEEVGSGPGRCLLAAALLHHDHHNEAHDLVQDLTDPDGSLVHAILHRREPDFWNARYWFRKAGDHPAYRRAMAGLPSTAGGEAASVLRRLTLAGTVDPGVLVDACEQAYGRPPGDPLVQFLRQVQQAEFEAVVAHLLGQLPA